MTTIRAGIPVILLLPCILAASAAAAAPPAPGGFTATAASSTQIDLVWTDVAGETGYEIRWQAAGGAWSSTINIAADSTTHSLTGLTEGVVHTAEIRAVNGDGSSAWVPASATTRLATPTGPTADATFSTEIVVTWTDKPSTLRPCPRPCGIKFPIG